LKFVDNCFSGEERESGFAYYHPRRSWSRGLFSFSCALGVAYPIITGLLHWYANGTWWVTSIPIMLKSIYLYQKLILTALLVTAFFPWSFLRLRRDAIENFFFLTVVETLARATILYIYINLTWLKSFSGLTLSEQGGVFETGVIYLLDSPKLILAILVAYAMLAVRWPFYTVATAFISAPLFCDLYFFGQPTAISSITYLVIVVFLTIAVIRAFKDWELKVPEWYFFPAFLASSAMIYVGMNSTFIQGIPHPGSTYWYDSGQRGILLYLVIYPGLNIIFDFLSIGATIFFLKMSIKKSLFYSLWDFLVGLALSFGLIATFTAYIFFLTPSNFTMISLPSLYHQIHIENPEFTWYFAIFFLSTLVPTLLHFLLFLVALVLSVSKGIFYRLANLFASEPMGVAFAWWALTGWVVGVFTLLVAGLHSLTQISPLIVSVFVWASTSIAMAIGAVDADTLHFGAYAGLRLDFIDKTVRYVPITDRPP
ncbi:MAG: hypothetical protein ABJN65_06945, partial [Parasphingorhabdus sp.]